MFCRSFIQPQRFRFSSKSVNSTVGEVIDKVKTSETPEIIKETILERWGKYWKNLYIDYKEVAIDVAKDCRERPVRASLYFSLAAGCFYFVKHNPDERSFREQLLQDSMKVMQVGEPIRNPISEHHVKWLGKCYNEGIIRRLNLGIFSLIWLDNYDEACALFKATCPYLKPRYLTFYERIVDIGFLDKWWFLEKKMEEYDINDAEFSAVQL